MEEDGKNEDNQDFLKFLFNQTPRTPELFIDLNESATDNLPSISYEEEEELHTRRLTEAYSEEIEASESNVVSSKIDDDKHQTLKLSLSLNEGQEEKEVSKFQTEADSSPLFIILDENSTDNLSSIGFEKEELHKRHQTEIFHEEKRVVETKRDSLSMEKDKHHSLKFTLQLSRGEKKMDVSKLKTERDIGPEQPILHSELKQETGYIQQQNEEQKALHVKMLEDVFQSITSSKPQIDIRHGKKIFETSKKNSEISNLLQSKPRPNILSFEILGEHCKKAPPTELQSDEMQTFSSSKFQESLKNKTCKNVYLSDMSDQNWRAIESRSPNEPCQTLNVSPETKSKKDQKFMPLKMTKKRHQTDEIELQKKSCQKAAISDSPNDLCKTSLVEESKMNQDDSSESLVIQSEGFQNVLSSDSSKINDKSYKNVSSSLLKNKACKNATSLDMYEQDSQAIKSPNNPNELYQTLEKSPQTKSRENQKVISFELTNKRHRAEVSQMQKKLCQKAAISDSLNDLCKTSLVEESKMDEDDFSESMIIQSEDFQNTLSLDSSKMKDKSYKNVSSSSLKNKTCKNTSSPGMCEKDCHVIKPSNPPNKLCQTLNLSPQAQNKGDQKLKLVKQRYLAGELSQLQKKLFHKAAAFEPQNKICEALLVEQLKVTKDHISESLVMQSEGFVLSANSSEMQDENYKNTESPLLKNKTCKNSSSSGVYGKSCQARKPSNVPNEPHQTLEISFYTKSKEEQNAIELTKMRLGTEKVTELEKKLYQNTTTSKKQNKLCKTLLTQRSQLNQDKIYVSLVMQSEDFKNILSPESSKLENDNYKNAESLLLKDKICKNATSLGMYEKDSQAIKSANVPNESYQTLEKSPQTKSRGDQKVICFELTNKRHRAEVSQLQKKLCQEATTSESQNKLCKTSLAEQAQINQDQVSEREMEIESFKNFLSSDSSEKVSKNILSSAFRHDQVQTSRQVLLKNEACQTEEEFLESPNEKDSTTVFTRVPNEEIQVVKHLALNAKQNRQKSGNPDVLPNTNIMSSRSLFKKEVISEFEKQNCQAFVDQKFQYNNFLTHSPTEIQKEEGETEMQSLIKNVKNRRNTPQLQSETSQIFMGFEQQNKQYQTEMVSSSENEINQATISQELQDKFVSQQFVLSSTSQNKNAQSISSAKLEEEKCEIIEQKDFLNEKFHEAVSNQVTVKHESSEIINEMHLSKINCETPISSSNTIHCTNISPLSALHGFVESINPPGNYQNVCTGRVTSQVYNITQSAPSTPDPEAPHSSLMLSENQFNSYGNHDNLERVNVNTNNNEIANVIAYPNFYERFDITAFHNTYTTMLIHPYSYGSHEIVLNPACTPGISPSGLIHNYCHFGGLILSKENCTNVCNVCKSCTNACNVCKSCTNACNVCKSCTNVCNVCKSCTNVCTSCASSTDLNESK